VPPAAKPTPPAEPEKAPAEPELIEAKADRLQGLKVLGKIELPVNNGNGRGGGGNSRNPVASSDSRDKKKRKRINKPEGASDRPGGQQRPGGGGPQGGQGQGGGNRPPQQGQGNRPGGGPGNRSGQGNNAGGNRPNRREEPSEKEIQDQIKATMARLSGGGNRPNFGADRRRDRRRARAGEREAQELQAQEESKTLKVTEFISANDLASLMDVSVNEVISVCMSLGMFVSINQRLDAEAITIITDEFGYAVQFVSAEEEVEAALVEDDDDPEDLQPRAPIVTIMGHVDHGKTSLLDYIRRTKVAAGEAGGITQHIGAYDVETDSGKRITFLDTPGHEAFTAMRARGAQVTDVVIIVIAADDSVMPQTREAINHAQNANVPIVFAFSKVDKPGANADKIREELAGMNLLVEEWGGKYQSQEISSKSGLGVPDLLEKVLLEAELLDLKANPNKRATGAVIEASLDKGRGYVTTLLVQNGTLHVGDVMLAGEHFGRVKAMFDHTGQKLKSAGPSTPVQVLGLNGAPTAGDKLNVVENEREAREIANKREQILREQSLRTRKHITLEEIGRRKAIGTFKELNVIVKGDVDGSVEALSDSLLKLSTEEVQVRIIHKGVGQVSESDVLLASTSDAIIVAFQVRPSVNARRLAEQEQIEIRNYSIIYDAINDVRDAMEGLLAPTMEENITATVEVREVFKISKIGTVAGCYVTDGTVKRNHKVRVLRDFVVIHDGEIAALKRFKDDVGEVRAGYECGMSIKNFNDIEVGDTFECYEMKEVKRTL
jgi:translation initiation factor IF-2